MALFAREFECPSCGGRIKRENAASKSLGCPYCGQTSHVSGDSLSMAGTPNLLIDYGSMFSVGMVATLRGRRFRVSGKLRIAYEDGFWDEWYIQFLDNNQDAWIQEDDGGFILFEPATDYERLSFHDIKVGGYYSFSNAYQQVFVTSKSRAKVEGGEGELPFAIIPGDIADFVEGVEDGKVISMEILPKETHISVGTPFKLDEVSLN